MKIVIVDIDGTLTKVGDRVNCILQENPNWNEFYARCSEDEPVQGVIDIVDRLMFDYRIVLCSGRRESCRQDTKGWLSKHAEFLCDDMLLRADGD